MMLLDDQTAKPMLENQTFIMQYVSGFRYTNYSSEKKFTILNFIISSGMQDVIIINAI